MKDLRRLLPLFGEYRRDLFLAMGFVLIETFFELVIPVLMADLIDVGVAGGDVHYILVKGAQMGLCAVLALIAGLLYARFAARAAYGWGANVRLAQFERVQAYAFGNLDRFETSSLVTRMTTDVTVLQNAVNGGLRPLVRSPVMLCMGVGLSFMMNARLALVFVVCAPVLACILFFVVRSVAPRYPLLQRAVDKLNAVVQEDLTAIRAVKAFVRGEYEEEKFSSVNTSLMETSRGTFRRAVLNLPSLQAAMYVSVVGIMWFGGGMITRSELLVGELTGFLSYVLQVMNSIMMISGIFLMLTRSLASARRIGEVLEEEPELSSPPEALTQVADGRVDFEGVSFKYRAEAAENALSGVELHIAAGETVGILGGTGSAKSTLVQLIPRLYDATEGRVLVGGRDVRDYDLGGVNVSGGQKQRLCIARALLKKPKVLIFDDSTSAVDTATEAKIRSALAQLGGMTKIIIAQRISSVMNTDKIVILEDGRIHAVGSHAELLASDPIYQEIYASQMKGGEPDGDAAEER